MRGYVMGPYVRKNNSKLFGFPESVFHRFSILVECRFQLALNLLHSQDARARKRERKSILVSLIRAWSEAKAEENGRKYFDASRGNDAQIKP